MRFFAVLLCALSALALAVEQEQPTPYDLIRPIWPMKWDTSATDDGGTVESFSKYTPNAKKHNTVPPVGTMPQDFVANGIIFVANGKIPVTLKRIAGNFLPPKHLQALECFWRKETQGPSGS